MFSLYPNYAEQNVSHAEVNLWGNSGETCITRGIPWDAKKSYFKAVRNYLPPKNIVMNRGNPTLTCETKEDKSNITLIYATLEA